MTTDERLVFLLQSTESLHTSLQGLHAIVTRHDNQIEKLTVKFDQVANTLGDLAIAVFKPRKTSSQIGRWRR
jgi:uncharacterized protein (DUF2141 family)